MWNWLRAFFGGAGRLTRQVQSPDPQVRREAALRLAALPGARANDLLILLLGDAVSAVREAARQSLRQHGVAALQPLLSALNHADANVGQAAAELLGELQRPETVEPLLTALKYGVRPVQMAARRALQTLGPLAVPALTAARDDAQPWVRRQVEEILETGLHESRSSGG